MASSSMSWMPMIFKLLGDPSLTVQTPAGVNNRDPWEPESHKVESRRVFKSGELQDMSLQAQKEARETGHPGGRRLNTWMVLKWKIGRNR